MVNLNHVSPLSLLSKKRVPRESDLTKSWETPSSKRITSVVKQQTRSKSICHTLRHFPTIASAEKLIRNKTRTFTDRPTKVGKRCKTKSTFILISQTGHTLGLARNKTNWYKFNMPEALSTVTKVQTNKPKTKKSNKSRVRLPPKETGPKRHYTHFTCSSNPLRVSEMDPELFFNPLQ